MCQNAVLCGNGLIVKAVLRLTLPNNKFLDWSKLKAFEDDKTFVTQKLKFVSGRVENVMGKGENAGHQHFRLFPQCFQKTSYTALLKVVFVW